MLFLLNECLLILHLPHYQDLHSIDVVGLHLMSTLPVKRFLRLSLSLALYRMFPLQWQSPNHDRLHPPKTR